jgi:hypothetical protein
MFGVSFDRSIGWGRKGSFVAFCEEPFVEDASDFDPLILVPLGTQAPRKARLRVRPAIVANRPAKKDMGNF